MPYLGCKHTGVVEFSDLGSMKKKTLKQKYVEKTKKCWKIARTIKTCLLQQRGPSELFKNSKR